MGMARRAGSGNRQAKQGQRKRSLERIGLTGWAVAGHHSWQKRRNGKRNAAGAITHAPKEWSGEARKYEEHHSMLAKQAELDAIREGLESIEVEVPVCEVCDCHSDQNPRVADERILNEALEYWLPNVSLNGRPILGDDYDHIISDEWWDDDYYAGTGYGERDDD